MEINSIEAAHNLIKNLEKLSETNESLKPFCDKIIAVIKTILDELIDAKKEIIFNKAYISSLEKKYKHLIAKNVILKICLGEDANKFIEYAANNIVNKYSKDDTI